MAKEKFVWLLDTQYPRRGPVLEMGKEYDVADFSAAAVDVWVKQGAAKYATIKRGESLTKKED